MNDLVKEINKERGSYAFQPIHKASHHTANILKEH